MQSHNPSVTKSEENEEVTSKQKPLFDDQPFWQPLIEWYKGQNGVKKHLTPDGTLNPFKNILRMGKKKGAIATAYEAFRGETEESARYLDLPKKIKHGIFTLLIGDPIHVLHTSIIDTINLGSALGQTMVRGVLSLYDQIDNIKSKKLHWPLRILASPLAIGGIILGGSLWLASFVFSTLAELVLKPIDLLVQKAVVPILSSIAAFITAPGVAAKRWIFDKGPAKAVVKDSEANSQAFNPELSILYENQIRNSQTMTNNPSAQMNKTQEAEPKKTVIEFPRNGATPTPVITTPETSRPTMGMGGRG